MVEDLILSNLIYNEGYGRKVIPFLRTEYFGTKYDKVIFDEIGAHVEKYNAFPNKVALNVELEQLTNLTQDEMSGVKKRVEELQEQSAEVDWLVDQTEKFCKDKAIYNAIFNSIQILDDKSGKTSPGLIPSLLEEALAVSFDTHIGHDYVDDASDRYEFYHKKEERVPFDLTYLNKITKGGLPRKTLNVVLAGCVHPDTKINVRIRKTHA
jgi:hypothetical protein